MALYLEECDPTLAGGHPERRRDLGDRTVDGSDHGPSPQLVERLVEQAIEQCRALDDGLAIERAGSAASAATRSAASPRPRRCSSSFGPAFLRHGLSALLIVSRSAEAASPYQIDVTPGNTKIPRGADQTVKAKLLGLHRRAKPR